MDKLTKNQLKAIKLAYLYGYYDYPRRVELKVLAKKMKVSLSTYREHIRLAEKKVICPLMAMFV